MLQTQTNRRSLLAMAVVAALAGFNPAQAGEDALKTVSVSAGSLDDALEALGRQCSVNVVYPSSQLKGMRTPGVSGVMETSAAFEKLLEGTPLVIKRDGDSLLITMPPRASVAVDENATAARYEKPLRLAEAQVVQTALTQSEEAADARAATQGPAGVASDSGSENLAEIIVTGSRLIRRDIEAVSPVSVVSDTEIAQRGFIRYEEILGHLPQLVTQQSETGRTFVNLRDLGPVRTLTLVNGRRLQPGGFGTSPESSAADPSLVPPGLIKSVEILTGGASSVYGADAVAGVVNFIMDTEFTGFKIAGGVSGFQHDNDNSMIPPLLDERGERWYAKGNSFDGPQYKFDMMAGGAFDDGNGHISAYLGWDQSSLLRMSARDYTSCALDDTAQCSGSFTAGRANFYFPDLDLDATLQDDGSLAPWSGNLGNWGSLLSMRHPAKRLRAGAFVNYEINEYARPYFELNFMRAETSNYYDEGGTFGVPADIRCDSPLLSPAQQQQICGPDGLNLGPTDTFNVNFYKRNVEGQARAWDKEYNSFRAVSGIKGDISENWRYDASFVYGTTVSSERGTNVFNRDRFLNAVNLTRDANGNVVCVVGGNCAPYMVFTPRGITQAALDYITTDHYIEGDATTYVVNAFVSGNLPLTIPSATHPLALVLGAEYRKEQFSTFFDDSLQQGAILGRTQELNTRGSYDVKEVFAEAAVPLVEDLPFVQNLSAELGYRMSDYNISGKHDTWKAGINYRPISQLKVRGGFNRAVRAPNVVELFSPQSSSLWNGEDPCAGANPSFTLEQCARTGVAPDRYGSVSADPVGQFNMIVGGNPDLEPETADTITFGFVASPLSGLNVSVDYWDIKIDDVIGLVDPQTALNQCALTGEATLCGLITRAPDGNLWLDLPSGAGGYIQATNANLGAWHFRGVDIGFDYLMPAGSGDLRLGLNGSRFLKKFYENIKGVAGSRYTCEGVYSSSCDFPTPKWRHTFEATYVSNSFWTATFHWRYYGAVENPEVDSGIDDGIGAQSYFDVSGMFEVSERINVVAGISNVLDKEPPLVSLNLSTNYFNTVDGYYDMLGRFLHFSVNMTF